MPGIGIVNNPEQQAKVAVLLASGLNQSQATNHLDISRVTVNRIANLPATKALIEEARNQIISTVLPRAVQNIQNCVDSALIPPNSQRCTTYTDKQGISHEVESKLSEDMRYWGLRYSEKMMESIGMMGSNTPNTVIQNFFTTESVIVNPIIDKLLAVITQRDQELPALDVSYEEVDK